ncbi:glycoside hydrolase family 6 protein [Actinomadura sp. ATCC 31491]|uniref:Glycoside hydrolase family 6 protein n=1 Tax=Actinomadura luzonensis TaxID=2805427 RepID=A0ABT0GAC9_9ACTN|nr:glycoside hydrolase family 6 protein [Actinomadura luzonensis]MCK2221558.1 glycoside hydrolase family 6 protein [Actinomadura luzonensis]
MRLRAGGSTALAAVLTGLLLTPAAPAEAATQLVANGAFTSSVSPWAAIGQAAASAESGRMRVDVTSVVAAPWDAMVATPTAAPLTPGRSYTLSFDAYATTALTARATVQYAATPSTNQSLATDVRLTTSSRRYSIPFTAAAASSTAAEVTFQLGGSGGTPTVRLDNVSLLETQATRPTALYASRLSNPAVWVDTHPDAPQAAAIEAGIASRPIFQWFGGWNSDLTLAVDDYVGRAQAADRLAMLVAYNIPNRDACAGHSGGGAGDAAGYHAWITEFARAIGTRHALVVLEPDAVAAAGCVTKVGKDPEDQYRMLLDATQVLRAQAPNAWVYLDAGNATWIRAVDLAPLLVRSGIANTRGFSVNVSNYITTADSETYASAVNGHLAGTVGAKKYVIDTSRNGNGPYTDATPDDNWCNPPGRKLGVTPRQQASGAEYLLWVKVPGDSDGPCGIAPATPAGTFSPELALALVNGTS